jgi:hypothetical protein
MAASASTTISAVSRPALQLTEALRLKIVKAAYKHDTSATVKVVERLIGTARLTSRKQADVQNHLAACSERDEAVLRAVLKIWFDGRQALGNYVRQVLVAAGHEVHEPDFGAPLRAGKLGTSPEPPGLCRSGEDAHQCRLMAWLLGWPTQAGDAESVPKSTLGKTAPASVQTQAEMGFDTNSNEEISNIEPDTPANPLPPIAADLDVPTLADLAVGIDSLHARMQAAAAIAEEQAAALRAGRLPAEENPDLKVLTAEFKAIELSLQHQAHLAGLPLLPDKSALPALREALQALQMAAEASAKVRLDLLQAQEILSQVAAIRHRRKAAFAPLLALQAQAEVAASELTEITPAAAALTTELRSGSHPLARFVTLVAMYEELHQADDNDSALTEAGEALRALPNGMELYTAWVMGLLEVGVHPAPIDASWPAADESSAVNSEDTNRLAAEPSSLTNANPTGPAPQNEVAEPSPLTGAANATSHSMEQQNTSYLETDKAEAAPAVLVGDSPSQLTTQKVAAAPVEIPAETHTLSQADEPDSASALNSNAPERSMASLVESKAPSLVFAGQRAGMDSVFWQLLNDGRDAWVYQLTRGQEALSTATDLSLLPPWLLRVGILGLRVRSAYGALAEILTYDALAFEEQALMDGPDEAPGTRALLAWAGALRPALVAPATDLGDWLVLEDLNEFPYLTALGQRIRDRLNPMPFSGEQLSQAQAQDRWQDQAQVLADDLDDWEAEQRQPTMFRRQRNHPITRFWQALLAPGSRVAQVLELLGQHAQPQVSDEAELGKALAILSSWSSLGAEMRRLGFTHDDIVTVNDNRYARVWLSDRVAELTELVRRYRELTQSRPTSAHAAWEQDDQELLHTLREEIPAADALLAQQHTAEENLPRRVALGKCRVALASLLDWLDQPTAMAEAGEPDPRNWLGLPWLLVSSAPPLNRQWEPEQDTPESQATLLAAAGEPQPDWADWYAHQFAGPTDLGPDHQLTARLLAARAALPPADAARLGSLPAPLEQLRHERGLQLAEQQRRLHQTLQHARRELERARRYGYADPEKGWYAQAQSTLDQLQALSGTRSDEDEDDLYNFRAHHAQLVQVREELDTLRQKEAERRRQAIASALAEANEKPSANDQQLLDQALAEGWFSLTDDYLSQLQRGHRLRQLSPAQLPALLTLEVGLNTLAEATQALEPYEIPVHLRAGTLLGPARSGADAMTDQRQLAAQAYESWCELRAITEMNAEGQALLRLTLEKVMRFLGFRVEKPENSGMVLGGERRNRYLDLKTQPLRGREQCPVGRYGSDADGEYRLLCLWTLPPAGELLALVRGNSNRDAGRPVIVVALEPIPWDQREALGVYCRQQYGDFLVLDELLLLHLATHGLDQVSQSSLLDKSLLRLFFQYALPFSYLNPFVTSGAVPPEMFFGRENDFRRLASRTKDSARILYGGRQLGKTVLLRRVADQTHDPTADSFVVFIDIQQLRHSTADKVQPDLSTLLLRHLREAGVEALLEKKDVPALSTILDELTKWVKAKPKRSLTLLLDEADYLLELDSLDNFKIVSELRNVMERTEQRIKIVLSGLHNVQHIYRLPNQPLIQLGQPIVIGPLSPQEGTALIQGPLESLGFHFGTATATGYEPAEHLIDQIGVETNYYPSLIQEFCSKLLEVLYKRQREDPDNYLRYFITEEDVQKASERAQPEIRHRFRLTLDLNPRFRLLAYLVAELTAQTTGSQLQAHSEPTASQVLEMARLYFERGFERPQHQHDYVEQLLEELVGLNILDRLGSDHDQTRYRLRTANVRTLLGTKADIQHELEKFSNAPPPLEYAVGVARDKYVPADAPTARTKTPRFLRSPLTVADLQQLEVQGVSIVYGTAAAGLDLLDEFFEGRTGTFKFKLHKVACQPEERLLKTRLDELRQQKKTRTQHLVLVEDCYAAKHIQQALAELERWPDTSARVRVLFQMGPATLWRFLNDEFTLDQLQNQGTTLMPLVPWNPLTVKEWLETENVASRQWEQVSETTGGWHLLLNQFFRLEQPVTGTSTPGNHPVQDVEQHLLQVQQSVGQGEHTEAWGLAEAPDFFRKLAHEVPDKPFNLEDVEWANLDSARPRPPADLPLWLRWAELLSLVLLKPEGKYQFNPLVAQALQAHA